MPARFPAWPPASSPVSAPTSRRPPNIRSEPRSDLPAILRLFSCPISFAKEIPDPRAGEDEPAPTPTPECDVGAAFTAARTGLGTLFSSRVVSRPPGRWAALRAEPRTWAPLLNLSEERTTTSPGSPARPRPGGLTLGPNIRIVYLPHRQTGHGSEGGRRWGDVRRWKSAPVRKGARPETTAMNTNESKNLTPRGASP